VCLISVTTDKQTSHLSGIGNPEPKDGTDYEQPNRPVEHWAQFFAGVTVHPLLASLIVPPSSASLVHLNNEVWLDFRKTKNLHDVPQLWHLRFLRLAIVLQQCFFIRGSKSYGASDLEFTNLVSHRGIYSAHSCTMTANCKQTNLSPSGGVAFEGKKVQIKYFAFPPQYPTEVVKTWDLLSPNEYVTQIADKNGKLKGASFKRIEP
jgi:hypothetical protein